MQIIHIAALVCAEPKPTTFEGREEKHDKILAILADINAPIDLGSAQKVSHDTKVDRYVATFTPSQGKSLTLKITNEVAAFIAEHVGAAGYWRGRMEDGALVDVFLIQQD